MFKQGKSPQRTNPTPIDLNSRRRQMYSATSRRNRMRLDPPTLLIHLLVKRTNTKRKLALNAASRLNIIYAPLIFCGGSYILVRHKEVQKTHTCASRPPLNVYSHLPNVYLSGCLVILMLRNPQSLCMWGGGAIENAESIDGNHADGPGT